MYPLVCLQLESCTFRWFWFPPLRAGPSYKQVKHLLEASKKLKKLTAKKGLNFKKKKIPTGPNLKEFWNKKKRKKKKKPIKKKTEIT